MNVKLTNQPQSVEVIDYVFREMSSIKTISKNDEEEERLITGSHFQLKYHALHKKLKGNIQVTLSYYDHENNYLGSDQGNSWHELASKQGVITMPVTIPSNTEHYQYQIAVDNTYSPFYSIVWKIVLLLLCILLMLGIVDILNI